MENIDDWVSVCYLSYQSKDLKMWIFCENYIKARKSHGGEGLQKTENFLIRPKLYYKRTLDKQTYQS